VTSSTHSPLPYTLQPFHAGRVHGLVHPQLATFVEALRASEQQTASPELPVYRQYPNRVYEVRVPAALGLPWPGLVVKRFGWRGVQHYLASPLKRSRAMKAYRTACHLLRHGLRTPLPVGVFAERRWGFVQYNAYVTAAVPEVITLQQYYATLPEGPAGLAEVLQLVADYTRRMHDSGLWHRDLVTSNVLLTGTAGQRQVYLVDLNRARQLPTMPLCVRAMDLARMGLQEGLGHFVAAYSTGRFSTTRLLWLMHLYGRWRTWRWRIRQVLRPLRARLRL